MDKKLVMAVAGSGKTYLICNSLDPEKRNLILAFTHENIKNIHRELLDRFGFIPKNTIVSTFHGFLFGDCIQPYQRLICDLYGVQPFSCEGVMFLPPPKPMNGTKYNVMYIKDNKLKHYIPKRKYYCSLMAKLILKNNGTILPTVLNRINKFYDAIFIDEYQDYRNEEYELLSAIIQGFNGDILLVGDYYQHSVSGDNNTGKPFGTAKKPKTYPEYKRIIEGLGVTVDETDDPAPERCTKLKVSQSGIMNAKEWDQCQGKHSRWSRSSSSYGRSRFYAGRARQSPRQCGKAISRNKPTIGGVSNMAG